MPIEARQQIYSTEDKFAKILEIISRIRNPGEALFIRNFILEICSRYLDKANELNKIASPSVTTMNKYETEYIERLIRELSSRDKTFS